MGVLNQDSSGHRARLRQRFLDVGLSGFAVHEQLELLLTFVIARKDCKPLAKALLKRFGSLPAVFQASLEELIAVEGIGWNAAVLIKLCRDLWAETLKLELKRRPLIVSAADVVHYLQTSDKDLRQEKFRVLFLDSQQQLLALETLSWGTIDQSPVYVRSIVEAVLRHNAKYVILSHNHPSGQVQPSEDDKRITKRIQEALALVEVRVLDHVIVGPQLEYFSFVDHQFM